MLFVPSARSDIQKYYLHTYLKFKETGDLLFYLTGVDQYAITGNVEDGREFKIYLSEDTPYEVDYILPHKSFFQYKDIATMLVRVPARQYFRGISPENTMVVFRGNNNESSTIPLTFDVLKAFVQKQKFYTLSEAIAKDTNLSSVLSPRMMYQTKTKGIYIDFVQVARVAADKKHIVMLAPIFKEDVQDFLKTSCEDHLFILTDKAK